MRIKIVLLLSGLVWVNLAAAPLPAQDAGAKAADFPKFDVPPKVIKREEPEYPYNQSRAGLIGEVKIEFVIDVEGRVRNPFVVESNNPSFERPALDAVLKWKFEPARKEGHVVNTLAQQLLVFELDHGEGDVPWRISKSKNQSELPPELRWDTAPVPVSTAFPVYPFEALKAEVKGKTQLRFVIGPNGTVVKAKVIQAPTPEMGLAVLAMIDVWRFTPAKKKDGTLAFATVSIEHEFNPYGRGDVPVTYAARDLLRLLAKHPEKIIAANQLDRPLKPVSRRPPVYPLALEATGQTGEAMIEILIDEAGDAQLPRIVSCSAPEFGYAAVQAVATWRFEPPKKNSKAVVTRVRVPLEFALSTGPMPDHHP